MGNRSLQRGISLLEMLIVIALMGILTLLAAPSLSDLVERNRTRALADLVRATLAQARAHSVINNQDMMLCGSSDDVSCDGGWGVGWLIISPAAGALPISSHRLAPHDRLHWQGFANAIRFRSNGTAPLGNGRFIICRNNHGVGWQVIINRQGRARLVAGLEQEQAAPAVCN